MSNEKLQEAALLYKNGNKTQATKILSEIVRQEPNNHAAWYGLALCLDEISKKSYCLKKVLSLDPSNQRARQLLTKLEKVDTPPINSQPIHTRAAASNSLPETKKTNRNWIYAIIALSSLLLVGVLSVSVFLFFKSGLLEKLASPEKKYSREIEPIFTKLDRWFQGPVANWDKVMSGNAIQGQKISNSELFAFYVALEDYPSLTSPDYQEETRIILVTNLIPTAESIVSDGYDIQVSLGGLTPPDTIKIAHQQVYDCVKYEVDRSNAMIKFLTEGSTVLAGNLNQASCTLLPNAIEKIKEFVQENR